MVRQNVKHDAPSLWMKLKSRDGVTCGLMAATIFVAGVAPVLCPVAGIAVPAGLVSNALFNWASEIGTGAVGGWLTGLAASLWQQAGKSRKHDDVSYTDVVLKEAKKLADTLSNDLSKGNVDLAIGICKVLERRGMLDDFEEAYGETIGRKPLAEGELVGYFKETIKALGDLEDLGDVGNELGCRLADNPGVQDKIRNELYSLLTIPLDELEEPSEIDLSLAALEKSTEPKLETDVILEEPSEIDLSLAALEKPPEPILETDAIPSEGSDINNMTEVVTTVVDAAESNTLADAARRRDALERKQATQNPLDGISPPNISRAPDGVQNQPGQTY